MKKQDLSMRIHSLFCGLGIAFLVETPGGLFLIDTGSPGCQAQVIRKMKELGRSDLKLIWITHAHYDHYGSAAALRSRTGARIGIHPADSDSMANGKSLLGTVREYGWIYLLFQPILMILQPLPKTPPDFTCEDGETLERLDARVLHTPGHTPGHSCLLLANKVVFVGDVIASNSPRLKAQNLLATDWQQMPASLKHLQEARPEWVYTGHSRNPLPGSALQEIAIP
jgi:glyoxylase-like metal-dependent hydrolase (beta-lactamase superfamily II)